MQPSVDHMNQALSCFMLGHLTQGLVFACADVENLETSMLKFTLKAFSKWARYKDDAIPAGLSKSQ